MRGSPERIFWDEIDANGGSDFSLLNKSQSRVINNQ